VAEYRYTVVFEPAEEGGYIASGVIVKCCGSAGHDQAASLG
jgi:predicted RNase H-like HicB family nuclease